MELDYWVTSASIIAEESKNKQLQDILKEAQNVVDNHDASKEKINEAVTNLEKTMNNLKKVETSTKNDDPTKDDTPSKKDEESNYSIYKQR